MPAILAAAFYLAAFGIGWLVLMFGWGLEPQSWPWIIGGTFVSLICAGIGGILAKAADD